MKRSMSRQAEAERERRARVIIADGELQASEKLAQAAEVMAEHPAALQLRLLQTVVEVAAERNSTLVLPFPVELLRFLERSTPSQPTRCRDPARAWTNRPIRGSAQYRGAQAVGERGHVMRPSDAASTRRAHRWVSCRGSAAEPPALRTSSAWPPTRVY